MSLMDMHKHKQAHHAVEPAECPIATRRCPLTKGDLTKDERASAHS